MSADLIYQPERDWLAIAWFTEGYRSLAERLAASLERYGIAHHLYARQLGDDWLANTRHKPDVVLGAFADHPDRTLVLLDVDVEVRGDLAPMAGLSGDVAASSATRRGDALPWKRRRRRLHVSSRAMVWQPTGAALALAGEWRRQCTLPDLRYGDETAFIEAYVRSEGVALSRLPARFGALDRADAPADAVVVHEDGTPPGGRALL